MLTIHIQKNVLRDEVDIVIDGYRTISVTQEALDSGSLMTIATGANKPDIFPEVDDATVQDS